jgi:hypothetical protein
MTWLKARKVEGEVTVVARQRFGKFASAATDTHAPIQELLNMVFYIRFMTIFCYEDHRGI